MLKKQTPKLYIFMKKVMFNQDPFDPFFIANQQRKNTRT